ncbi:tail protein [Tanticharoenia sakaeratensis]|uniref:Phage tail sheath protein n=1 Tax=Tanticharoenia sakaeratensis NBRC 103193 TaxID=1231623 RepID=A0A0D6MQM5_9PROT|nr:tail protein [Tanticharoenia sakaeratensis]GAN55578.1 phage tail sheath protein [Tanticharoenia sakaeratensis NBRC 103193]GBQ21695.1 phage tail sheath protein [Tanticharoenia sakaeratensis NBRC 103193]
MSLIYQAGSLNTAALTVPNLYVQIAQPQSLTLSGVSSSTIGIVGTAGWGPVDMPVPLGGTGDYAVSFGPKQAKTTDIGIAVNAAALQGATSFCAVRVTDGTDAAATASLDGVELAAVCTGTAGNAIVVTVSTSGSGFAMVVAHPTLGTFSYGGANWTALAAAVAADSQRLISVSVPGTVPAVAAGTVTLTGGADGGVPSTTAFVGQDISPRTGMYALRGQGCAIGMLHGVSDSSCFTTQSAFGLGEGIYMIATGPSSDTIANAIATKAASGLNSYAVKLMFGDWIWWRDDLNGLMLITPQAFTAGILGALSPEKSSLNKSLAGIVGSQKAGLSGGSATYSSADLATLFASGIDVICNPAPGGAYWAVRCGHNSSTNVAISGDNYTRLTNFLAETFSAGMGTYVGSVINDTLFGDIRATLLGFLSGLLSQGILGVTNGALPYAVVCDASNNPASRIAQGYVQADVQVQYQGINEKFIVNLQGGASVSVATTAGSV